MTHGFMFQVDPQPKVGSTLRCYVWCLCSKWNLVVDITYTRLAGNEVVSTIVFGEGAYEYQQHIRETHQIDEPSAHKWIPSSDGIETCEHCDMVRTV